MALDDVLAALQTVQAKLNTSVQGKGVAVPDESHLYTINKGITMIPVGGSSGGGSAKYYKCATVDTTAKTWTGYELILTNGVYVVSDTETTGLVYTSVTPAFGAVYSEDALIRVGFYYSGMIEGLVFYAPLRESSTADELGNELNNYHVSFGDYGLNRSVLLLTSTPQYIEYPVAIVPTTEFTLSAFARMDVDNCGYYGNIIAFGNEGGKSTQVSICRDSSVVSMNAWSDGNIGIFTSTLDNNWHHYLLTYKDSVLTGYFDGVQVFSAEWSSQNLNMQHAAIGSWSGMSSSDRQWIGGIAEAKIYDVALTADQVKTEADTCLAMITA